MAAPLATLALFGTGRWAFRRSNTFWFPRAVIATAALAAVTWGVLALIGATRRNLLASCLALVGTSILWMPVTRRWNARAHLCWATTWLLFVAYLAFMIQWTFASRLGFGGTLGSLLLWLLEVVAALMGALIYGSCATRWAGLSGDDECRYEICLRYGAPCRL